MGKLIVHEDKLNSKAIKDLIGICPFGALQEKGGKVVVTSACKMCKSCVKKGPEGAVEFLEGEVQNIDKSLWNGVAIYVEHLDGNIHPVTYELIGKARELASKISQPVYAVFLGNGIESKCEELLHYGVDEIFVYDYEELKYFRIEPYTAALEDFINKVRPGTLLVGATTVGRSLAPRIAARFSTGLTADCTVLDMKENTDLVQIRPAFGGNIMARIINPNHRPQLATVRYKVMDAPKRSDKISGKIKIESLDKNKLKSRINVMEVYKKSLEMEISDADVIVAAGRGVKSEKDMDLINELADLLGARIASTRPLVEAGWVEAKNQIGLSGRTVKPKLIITCGISGSVQFAAGMKGSDMIIAINKDPNAAIFDISNYGVVGDLYEIVPKLIQKIKDVTITGCKAI